MALHTLSVGIWENIRMFEKKIKLTEAELAKIKKDSYRKGAREGKMDAIIPDFYFEASFPKTFNYGTITIGDKSFKCYIGKVVHEFGKAVWTVIEA